MDKRSTLNSNILVSIVIPCFNEESNIVPLFEDLNKKLIYIPKFEIIYVDDGSTDNTLIVIKHLSKQDTRIKYISLSRNFGQQNAIKAGLDYALGDCVITMDGDLQHPSDIIFEMIEKWVEGYQIVNAIRETGNNIPYFKKISSQAFYRIINSTSETYIEPKGADFRLLDRSVVNILKEMKEPSPFFRGLVSWIGFRRTTVSYKMSKRYSGISKYSLSKMLILADRGLTSFTTFPLRISFIIGLLSTIAGFSYGLYALFIAFFTSSAVHGWTSIIICILFYSGIQLIVLGILGEYVGKIYIESKGRPTYIIKENNC
ncbi:glycosyltransferase family 2 protein [Chitinophaga polysaccharea]|uniref:glycosyltransferase family 2 protein n=1 Tax=Chitinophaga polysaccharea TaxID=1293035 RepID=UPI001159CA6C|nr:glycosyltransferase family 2 protein [Chitinophaga polysaccharea]